MLFFARKHKLLETSFFEGFKDFHNHLLPAVDDGVRTMEESLATLGYFEKLRVGEVILTPHVMVGVNDSSQLVESQFVALKEAYKGEIKLTLASEYMLDSNFKRHFESGSYRGIDKSHILVETSYMSAPPNINELLYNIAEEGITPIIAHPERYLYMDRSNYHTLKDREYMFQFNLLSLSGTYGDKVAQTAIYLLENDMYDVVGSDLHNLDSFRSRVAKISLKSKHLDKLLALKERIL